MAQAATGGGSGSRTVTVQAADGAAPFSSPPREEVLSLRLGRRRTKKVSWTPETVDNELLNKKSSKKCCVFHKDHGFDSDSSDEEEANPGRGTRKTEECDAHGHGHGHGHEGCGKDRSVDAGAGSSASTSGSQGQF